MQTITSERIGQQIQAFFGGTVEVVARASKFVQRRSKLTGQKFLQALVFTCIEKTSMTIASLADSCLDLGVNISEQAVDERLNQTAVLFLRQMFERALRHFQSQQALEVELLQQFKHIYLVDSSQISLPATMAELFPGAGGEGGEASWKMQLVFDYLFGQFAQLEERNGRQPDQGYRGHWALIEAGALFLLDLGYFALDTFRQIADQGAYFLSRLQGQTAVLSASGQRLDLATLLAAQRETQAEYSVLIGARPQHRIPCRLIAIRLPQEAADRQRQKAKDNAKRHGRTPDQAYLQLLDWALFITNVPQTMLRTEHVAALYRIRWQVELVFKLCKSFAALDVVASLRPARVLCELYAKLIGVLLTYFLIAPVRLPDATAPQREISPVKVRLLLQRFARSFSRSLGNRAAFCAEVDTFFRHVLRRAYKQIRRKKPNALFAIALLSACYDWSPNDFSPDFLCLPS